MLSVPVMDLSLTFTLACRLHCSLVQRELNLLQLPLKFLSHHFWKLRACNNKVTYPRTTNIPGAIDSA